MQSTAALSRRFEIAETAVTVAGRRLELAHPISVDDLLDEDDYNRHQRLPYWGTLWPSARLLAARVADAEGRGRRLLELGCGVGLVSLSAALAGFEVLATDYYEDALEFVVANAQHNGLGGIVTRCVDWRQYPSDLVGFDLIVASDVLYERPNASLVAAAIAHSLAPQGIALVTDPGRQVARPFAVECRQRGLECDCVDLEQIVDGQVDAIVELYEIAWQGAARQQNTGKSPRAW
ncbi:MAG TPA: methyltransferase domain-containing protein [Pirellulales bacterium]|jgi:predicted nicotinamide N-methyase|nr:methyltransferase domain-containing protein [Pirellulales bacterium]